MQLSEHKVKQVLDLAHTGKSVTEIMSLTGVTNQSIHLQCRRAGVQLHKKPLGRRIWTQEQIDRCVSLYQSGLGMEKVCDSMGVTRKAVRKYLKQRQIPIRGKGNAGEKNPAWRGGVIKDAEGYILVYAPDHPHHTKTNRVRRHRLVMERTLGRYLEPHEVVDHINGIPGDDRPENLRVFASNAEHLRVTLKGRRPRWSAAGQVQMLAGRRVFELRRTLGRSTLGAAQLPRKMYHRCKPRTCQPFCIVREVKLALRSNARRQEQKHETAGEFQTAA